MKFASKLVLIYLPLSLVTLAAIGMLTYHSAQRALSEEALLSIDYIVGTQRERLENIIEQNLERLALVASRTQLRLSLASYIADPKSQHQDKINRILVDARSSIAGFQHLYVLTLDGKVVASTNTSAMGRNYPDTRLFINGQKHNSVETLYLDAEGDLGLRLAGPLTLDNSIIGVLVVEKSADNIVALTTNYQGLGDTGETLLVRKIGSGDAQFITPARFDPKAALNRFVSKDNSNSPVIQSLSGQGQQVIEAVDYLGYPVIAAFRHITRTGWGVVVQQRKSEAFDSIYGLRDSIISIVFLFALVIIILLVFVARSVTRPIVKLTEVATRISEGNLSDRAEVRQSDEVGMLATAFNRMTDHLVKDIGERKAAEEKFYGLLRAAPDAIVIVDARGKIVLTNIQAENLFGYTAAELKGRPVELLMPERYRNHHGKLRDNYQTKPHLRPMARNMELYGLRKDGVEFPIEVSLSPITSGDGTLVASAIRDISDRKKTEALLLQQANFDTLTDLPNRVLAFDRLSQALARAQRDHCHVALMFIDIDRFKDVNDTLGHTVGDELLVEVAKRLLSCVREQDTVARLGGDEFLIILSDLHHVSEAELVAGKVLSAIKRPYVLEGRDLFVSASIGITSYPDDSKNPHILLRNADVAMYRAKDAGRNTSRFFTPEINQQLNRRLELEQHLRYAIENDELSIYYQPQVCIKTLNVVGAEALLRWNNPKLGAVAPDEFIPLAEDSGLIASIGEWVLQAACRDAKAWQAFTTLPLRIAVNISPQQFRGDKLLGTVARVLEDSALAPELLELEITENLLVKDVPDTSELTHELKKLGVRLVLDDFGTGYSSLSYLKRFPFDVLKIDRAFVSDIPGNKENLSLCKAIIAMAESLDLEVVGEGVETADQLRFLRDHGANIAQGYYFGKPVPVTEFHSMVNGNNKLMGHAAN